MDARPLSTRVSGVGRLLAETLMAFPDKNHFEFLLFSHRPIHESHQKVLQLANVHVYPARGWLARKGGLFYNLHLPMAIPDLKLDLFWGSQQILPPFLPSTLPTVLTYCDLVLYLYPHTMRRIARWQQKLFQAYSVKRADYILSISEQTRVDVNQHFQYPEIQTGVAYPGFDKQEIANLLAATPSEMVRQINEPFLLSVSTIEPRKNYRFLLEVYKIYRQQKKEPLKWVIVGRRGWESDEFFAELEQISRQSGDIILFESADDVDLHHLYQKSHLFLFASHYEGFGIPLLEALAHNKPCIVSDIPTFHEIGKDKIYYLPTNNPHIWAEQIVQLENHYSLPNPQLEEFSWQRSAHITKKIFEQFL